MRIVSKPYGEIEIDDRQIISFPFGLFGFEQLHRFALLDARQKPFFWLQSLDVPDIAFVLIDPTVFRPDYHHGAPEDELEEIEVEGEDEAIVFSIVTIPEDQAGMTANLQGPVIINRKKRIGRQSITLDPQWKIRHVIMEELAGVRNEA